MLLALFIFALQMHTDMGDERGIRLRCICLGRAALRGSRMRGMGICSKVSEPCFARSSLSIARSSVCADLGVCVLRAVHKNVPRLLPSPSSKSRYKHWGATADPPTSEPRPQKIPPPQRLASEPSGASSPGFQRV